MNDLVRFAQNVQFAMGKKRGRRPVFNSRMFFPYKEELRLRLITKREFERFIAEAYAAAVQGESFADDMSDLLNLGEDLPEDFKEKVAGVAEAIRKNVSNAIANSSEMIVGKPYYPPEAKEDIFTTWEANFQMLCKSAEADAKKDMAQLVSQAKNEGWNGKQLERAVRKDLPEKYANRAALIARTESAKLNSEATRSTFREMGVRYYMWMSTLDERTRSNHAMMNGLICNVDDPTVYYEETPEGLVEKERDGSMVHLHPGYDFQCRCTMVMWDPAIDGKYEVKEEPEKEPEEKEPTKLEAAREETEKEKAARLEAESRLRLMTAANRRHMERTPEQAAAIVARWEERNRRIRIRQAAEKRHAERDPQKILNEMNKRLQLRAEARALVSELSGIEGVKTEPLTKAVATGNSKKIKKAMTALEKTKKEIESLEYIENPVESAKKYGYESVKSANEAIGAKFKQWEGLDEAKYIKKLNFEIEWVEKNKKYATWELSQKAYKKALATVKFKNELAGLKLEVKALDDYAKGSKSKILKGLVAEVDKKAAEAKDIGDLEELRTLIDNANKKRYELDRKKVKFTGIDQARRDNAFWAKRPMEYYDEFIAETGRTWNSLNRLEKESVYYYTHTYCPINEPLRSINYIGSREKLNTSVAKIPHITSAIEKSEISRDVWLMRGDSDINVIKYRFGVDISGMNVNEARKVLIGKEGIEKAFVSCGSSKGTGFDSKNVIFNIFAPKGTKGIYVEPVSRFGNGTMGENWDGVKRQSSASKENETLLQRGTKFRITKVDRRGSRWYIDVDVIGQEPQPY